MAHPAMVIATATVVSAVVVRNSPRAAARILAAPLVAFVVGTVLKKTIRRPRPPRHRHLGKGRESFPSNHTAVTAAFLTAAASTLPLSRGARVALGTLVAGNVLVVAMGRVAVGAHWPTDTMAGAALGVGAAAAVAALTRKRPSALERLVRVSRQLRHIFRASA